MQNREAQFNSLVANYSERLYWHIRGIVGSHDDADDLVQDVFVKAWKSLPEFRGDSEIFTWLWRIATNEAISFMRKARVRAALSFSSINDEAERVCDPDPYFDGDAAMTSLRKAITSLPDKQRVVFTMRYYEELSYEQISEITGTSVGALKASYHQAFGKIRRKLGIDD